MVRRNKKNKLQKSRLIQMIIAVAVIVILACGVVLIVHHYNKPTTVVTTSSGYKRIQTPAQQNAQSNANKATILEQQQEAQQQEAQSAAGTKIQVTVTITNATISSVNSFVSGVFENGGTCTATFTQGSTVITRTSTGFENASYTQCPPITPDLPNTNQWSVVVSYSSPTAQGTSAAQTLQTQ